MKALLLILPFVFLGTIDIKAQDTSQACVTDRNAPPVGSYYWPPDSTIKVYFTRNSFTSEQRVRLSDAMTIWTLAAKRAGADVNFLDAGETAGLINCQGCLTLSRSEVYKRDRKHYAFFHPLTRAKDGLLISAWIDFDVATTNPTALQGFMAHELGHGMGLWDCKTCKKKQTIMNGFPDVNRDNGLLSPSACDLEVVRRVYQTQRQLPTVASLRSDASQEPR